jgi:hypothetical protein
MKDSSACTSHVDSVFDFSRAVKVDAEEWDIAIEGTRPGGVVCFGTQQVISIVVLGLWTH